MKKYVRYALVCTVVLAGGAWQSFCAEEEAAPTRPPLSRTETVLVNVTATVEAINYTNREVTLKGPLGNKVTFTVDQRVKRLNEVQVGDLVEADYYVSIAAEVREPTPEEQKTPIVLLGAAAKAPPGTSPAAGGLRQFKAVTTIEGLDRPTKTITVKGPLGNYLTARVVDPERLTLVRIGDTVVITYTEALAIGLRKAEKKDAN